MMKFFRKHRKAVSPVIATMLLVAVAVAAVGAYFIWFRSFQTQSQGSVQEAASGALGSEVQVANIANDAQRYYISLRNAGTANVSITDIKIGVDSNNTLFDGGTGNEAPVKIIPGNSQTLIYTRYGATSNPITPTRGTTRTFTIAYKLGEPTATNAPTGVVVHTYTDSN
ncbi:MAG: archaellin/type IV pilin N-terminal domain-containing protein [Methanofastidiosum sp.]